MAPRSAYRKLILPLAMIVAVAALPAWAVEDFCFVQLTDVHISPRPTGFRAPRPTDRSVTHIAQFCQTLSQPQQLVPYDITIPAPAFGVVTGDITEFGVIGQTWPTVLELFAPCQPPLYFLAGNHDNTWTTISPILRQRYGYDHYSFDRFGCHFVFINTATIQEPVPSIDRRTLTWLADDLKTVAPATPIFLFGHHPLTCDEFAQPYEPIRLLELLDNHNVVLYAMGHDHEVHHQRWNGVDAIMCSATFGDDGGYMVFSVTDNILRAAFAYFDPEQAMVPVLTKIIDTKPIPANPIHWIEPKPTETTWTTSRPLRVNIDTTEVKRCQAQWGLTKPVILSPDEHQPGHFVGQLPLVPNIAPGRYRLVVSAETEDGPWSQMREIDYRPTNTTVRWDICQLPAGIKAAPVATENGVIAATTDGEIYRVQFSQDNVQAERLFKAPGALIASPTVDNDRFYFTCGDGHVYAITTDGRLLWKTDIAAAAFGSPIQNQGRLYLGDLEGVVHALDAQTGQLLYSRKHATFSIEQTLTFHQDVLYFGAWDGYVYAVNAQNGTLRWKARGPAGHRQERKYQSRYYGPADCSPVVLNDRLFVTDRAYCLGSYTLDGQYLGEIEQDIAAISRDPQGRYLAARSKEHQLRCYDPTDELLWSRDIALGRFPIPPTFHADQLLACSNRGLLSVIDTQTGQLDWQFQLAGQLHLMAPVVADESAIYAGDMDGNLIRLVRPETQK